MKNRVKMFVNLKKNSMFASFIAKNDNQIKAGGSIFYFNTVSADAENIQGYQIPSSYCTAKSVIVLGGTGGDSLSYIQLTNNFRSTMPRTTKITERVNKSNSIRTPHSAKTFSDFTFQDVLTDLEARFSVEKNAKNKAYAFILAMGLLEEFKTFTGVTQDIEDKHDLALSFINL